MQRDECIEGTLTCKPNSANHRDLDFEIAYTFDGQIDGKHAAAHTYRMR